MSSTDTYKTSIPKDAFTKEQLLLCIKKGVVPYNAISWTAENGYTELTKSLIESGAKINENQNYPLELASRNGHTEIVKILIEAGAKTSDSENDEGYCLRMAAYNGDEAIVKMLLDAGANPMANNYYALHLAFNMNNMSIVEILLDAIYKKRQN